MNVPFPALSSDFLARLLAGIALNFEIATIALFLGLVIGIPLGYAVASPGKLGLHLASNAVTTLLRGVPSFVVMFFLFNLLPQSFSLFGRTIPISGILIVSLSLTPYSLSYVAGNFAEALRRWRSGAPAAALLFLPNTARAGFVLVMSSGAGAAIGVNEGIAVILHQTERLPNLTDRLSFFAIGILIFCSIMQSGFFLVKLIQRELTSRVGAVELASSVA
jgi:hypothetical protein